MFCLHSRHLCGRDRLAGFDFCLAHILEDKSAPFKQCNFHLKAQKRCQRPASKADKKDGYCAEHSRRALLARQKTGRKRPADLVQRCLEDLAHYKKERLSQPAAAEQPDRPGGLPVEAERVTPVEEEGAVAALEGTSTPVVEVKVEEVVAQRDVFDLLSSASIPSVSQRVIDGSEVESEGEEAAAVETAWRGDGDSDAESVDSDMEDPLKHAGAYSAEEVIRVMRDKLIRLQKLYIDQFQRLHHLLREERREYRHALCREKEDAFAAIHAQPRDTPAERAAYAKIKALLHYSRPQGVEAVLHAQLMEKRARASEPANSARPPTAALSTVAKCVHSVTTNTKCGEQCVPMARHCAKHILEDAGQVLYRACAFVTEADGPCETPIADVLEGSTCVYHTQLAASVYDEKEQERRDAREEQRLKQREEVKVEPKNRQDSLGDEPPQAAIVPEAIKKKR